MNKNELQSMMQKWADQNGSKLEQNTINKRGHDSAFSFIWTKPLWVLGEEGWEVEEDVGAPVRVWALEDGEMFFGPDIADEDEGYSMVILMDEAEEVDQALELLWNATETVMVDPMPENLVGTRIGELREWFELNFTPEDDTCDCEDCENCEDCEGSCSCEHEHEHQLDSRMVTIATDAAPKAQVHCPVCGKAAAPGSCSHLLFINENATILTYISDSFSKNLEERGVDQADFITDPEQLRDDDSWDSDYLFLDVLQIADDAEVGTNYYVGFHCKW